MKFDRDIITGVVVCAVILLAWGPVSRKMGWAPEPPAPAAAAPAASVAQSAPPASAAVDSPAAHAAVAAPAETVPETERFDTSKLNSRQISTSQLDVVFDPASGSIDKFILNDYLKSGGENVPVEIDQRQTGVVGAMGFFDRTDSWVLLGVEERSDAGNYALTRELAGRGGRFTLEQEWAVGKDYTTGMSATFTNRGSSPVVFGELVLNGADLPPWSRISGDKIRIPSHRVDILTVNGSYIDLKADKKDADFFLSKPEEVQWISVGNKYFAAILDAPRPFMLYQGRAKFADAGKDEMLVTVGANLGQLVLQPGESRKFEFSIYSGPKIISNLRAFEPTAAKVMHLAWGPLDYLARLLLWVLVELNQFCEYCGISVAMGSYGVSIIILTLIVRILFYPLTAKGNASMRRMQKVQPKIKALREKYKDNPQQLNAKTMELYREEKINPFGGCLPILLQIPVFFALYATLDGAVELRQVPFLWADNLAAADTVATINLHWFNLAINPLVIAMTVLMVVQQHMTPMSMDPSQKKIMMIMPVVMLVLLYDLPSGLTLYWTVSNLFSIVQLRMQQRKNDDEGKCAAGAKA